MVLTSYYLNYNMDILLICLGFILLIIGLIGSFLPVLPGPPISWLGLLTLYFTSAQPVGWVFLGFTLLIAITIAVLDYIIPAAGTKRFGGSRAGAIGTTIGLIIGILTPIPFGILIGPFAGALVGELVFNGSNTKQAFKAALGSFLGFIASTFMKFVISVIFIVLFIVQIINNYTNFSAEF